jgi:hypothetical protein
LAWNPGQVFAVVYPSLVCIVEKLDFSFLPEDADELDATAPAQV